MDERDKRGMVAFITFWIFVAGSAGFGHWMESAGAGWWMFAVLTVAEVWAEKDDK